MADPQASYPLDLSDMVDWISSRTPRGGRVLEIGSGDGAIVDALADRGYAVVGVDPGAATNANVVAQTFETFDAEPFDTVFASLSLHHLHDIDAAAAALRRLTRSGSTVLVREFDRARLDEHEPTLRWWWHQRAARTLAEGGEPDAYEAFVEHWRHHMAEHVHPWAVVELMLRRAELESTTAGDGAFLFRWGLTEDVRPVEERLIASGGLRPIGVRWAGIRR